MGNKNFFASNDERKDIEKFSLKVGKRVLEKCI